MSDELQDPDDGLEPNLNPFDQLKAILDHPDASMDQKLERIVETLNHLDAQLLEAVSKFSADEIEEAFTAFVALRGERRECPIRKLSDRGRMCSRVKKTGQPGRSLCAGVRSPDPTAQRIGQCLNSIRLTPNFGTLELARRFERAGSGFPMSLIIDTRSGSHNICYVNQFIQGGQLSARFRFPTP